MPVPVISFLMTEPPTAHMTQESILIRRSPLASDWALANETWVGLLGAFPVRFLYSKKRTRKGSDISLPAAGVIPFSLLLRFTTNQTSITKKAWLPQHPDHLRESHISMPLKVGVFHHRGGKQRGVAGEWEVTKAVAGGQGARVTLSDKGGGGWRWVGVCPTHVL